MTEEQQPSNVDFLLAELRRARKHAGLTQEEQGRRMGYSASMVAMVENGTRRLPPDYLALVDKALATGGLFVRLGAQFRVDETPQWRRQRDALEREAVSLRWFEHAYVPGLLQTEDYARALFSGGGLLNPEEVERRVSQRLVSRN